MGDGEVEGDTVGDIERDAARELDTDAVTLGVAVTTGVLLRDTDTDGVASTLAPRLRVMDGDGARDNDTDGDAATLADVDGDGDVDAVGATDGDGVLLAIRHSTWINRDFPVPLHGSPKFALVAATVHELRPMQAAWTMAKVAADLHVPKFGLPHGPDGLPYEAKSMLLMMEPTAQVMTTLPLSGALPHTVVVDTMHVACAASDCAARGAARRAARRGEAVDGAGARALARANARTTAQLFSTLSPSLCRCTGLRRCRWRRGGCSFAAPRRPPSPPRRRRPGCRRRPRRRRRRHWACRKRRCPARR